MTAPAAIQKHPQGVVLNVRVQPKASRNAFRGLHGQAVKISLTAPPVDGAANNALIAFLSKQLKCPKADIEIIAGAASRNKRLLLRVPPGPGFKAGCEALQKGLAKWI
jgi:uncharacterized protein (TIGR00251 family)